MQENCTSGLPSGDWKREGILFVQQPVCAPVIDSTVIDCISRAFAMARSRYANFYRPDFHLTNALRVSFSGSRYLRQHTKVAQKLR